MEYGDQYRWTDGKYNLLKSTDHRKDIKLYKLHGSLLYRITLRRCQRSGCGTVLRKDTV